MQMKLSYYELFSRLKFVTRFSGDNLLQPERLESHVIEMVGLVFDLYYGVGGFDLKQAIYLTVIHDIDESITVDVPRPFKYFDPEFRAKLGETVHNYFKSIGVDDEFLNDSENAKEIGFEGRIVKLLDLVQVQRKLQTELKLGNTTVTEMLSKVTNYIESLREDEKLTKYIDFLNN